VPQLRESESSVRGRPSIDYSGHARLRQALYMATLSAIQHNPLIKAFYQRLIAKGKAKKLPCMLLHESCCGSLGLWRPRSSRLTWPMWSIELLAPLECEADGEAPPRQVKTARRRVVPVRHHNAMPRACLGLDRRGKLASATRASKEGLTENTVSLKVGFGVTVISI
jgi:hypothetical protein